MEVILSKQCLALTGCLGRGFGYFLVNRKGRFYSQRSKHSVPPDGHWRFIVLCAELAQNKLHITDIRVSKEEVDAARIEAGLEPIAYCLPGDDLNALLVLYIKNHYTS